MKINRKALKSRGWSDKELDHAEGVFKKAEYSKHHALQFIDSGLYWVMLMLLIIGSIATAIFLVPFLFGINTSFVIIIIGIIGFLFGIITGAVAEDMERTKSHKVLDSILLVIGFINSILVTYFSTIFSSRTGIPLMLDPYMAGLIYFVSYSIPHVVRVIRQHYRNK